jgi:hypothetical protein
LKLPAQFTIYTQDKYISLLLWQTIIQIFGPCCCYKDSSCGPTKNAVILKDESANSVDTSSGSSDHATQSCTKETPASPSSSEESGLIVVLF